MNGWMKMRERERNNNKNNNFSFITTINMRTKTKLNLTQRTCYKIKAFNKITHFTFWLIIPSRVDWKCMVFSVFMVPISPRSFFLFVCASYFCGILINITNARESKALFIVIKLLTKSPINSYDTQDRKIKGNLDVF